MKKYCALLFIVLLAGFLRFYRLGTNPPSLDWDEASLGYNAWSLLQTGRDEFGNSWPLTIRSFGDYKPPLYTYLLIPTFYILGRSEFSVRFPSALAGTLTILVTYFLVIELLEEVKYKNLLKYAPPLASFLLAISPWHLQFSRIAFEANLGLFFFVAGMWQFIRWLKGSSTRAVFFSSLLFSFALMSYHSLRLVAPLIIVVALVIYRDKIFQLLSTNKRLVYVALVPTVLTVFTIAYTVFVQKVGQARFSETSIFTITKLLDTPKSRIERFNENPIDKIVNHRDFIYAKQYIAGYMDHFSLRFWLLDGDRIDRHRAPDVGLLYFWEFPFLIVGFWKIIKSIRRNKPIQLLLAWFFLAPAASAATGGTPSAVRSLIFLPTFQIFTAIGIVVIFGMIGELKKKNVLALLLSTVYSMLCVFEIVHYFHQYYVHAPIEYAKAWQYGYKEVVRRVIEGRKNVDQIIVTTSYDQPYIYFLWYGDYDPAMWINNGEFNKGFDKFLFRKIDYQEMKTLPHTMIIGDPLEMGGGAYIWTVSYPDGLPAFVASETL